MTHQQTPPPEAGFFTTIRGWGLTRSDARVFSGVAGGVAERLGWSRAWTRVGLVGLAIVLNGIVLLAYAAAWALLPDRRGRIIAQDFGRGVPNVGALVVISLVALVGLASIDNTGPWQWSANAAWNDGMGGGVFRAAAAILAVAVPLGVLAAIIGLIVYLVRRDRHRDGATPPSGTPGGGPQYAAPPQWAADRRAQREAARQARHEHRQAYRTAVAEQVAADVSAAADEAAASAQEAADAAAGYAAPYGAPYAVPPAAPTRPPRPPRPARVPGPGAPFYLLTLAWLILSIAGIAIADRQGDLAVQPLVAWGALFVTGVGVILMLVALSGRRLGFLAFASAVMLIPTAIFIAKADDVRDSWAEPYFPDVQVDGDGIHIGVGDPDVEASSSFEAEPEPTPYDALSAFDGDYATITLPAGCYAIDEAPPSDGMSRGLLAKTGLEKAAAVDVTAAYTTVRIAAGGSLAVTADQAVPTSVYWPDRGVACDLYSGEPLTLSNPGDPLLTLDTASSTDGYATIVIEEVAS
ncbi:PspC domain-containing protein [Demequina subtropica]|uniref:PspC domain-containing protein n=1 Tax=Demequina subtropica TaxID=1638989 RepID=UPI0007809CFD|nr:PspC domain-containing protein [Demequina subtropica]